MRLTLKDKLAKDALNQERYRYGTDFLQNLIFCNGFPVIVKGKYDIASREENRLVFMIPHYLKQTVYCFSLTACKLCHSLSGTSRRCCKCNLQTVFIKNTYCDTGYRKRLSELQEDE